MARTGRPKININWAEAEKLCAMQCTEQEIVDWFHISIWTLDHRLREEKGMTFPQFFALHRTSGKIALRRNLFQLSQKQGHVAIFLAKNWLNMKDTQEVTGEGGKAIEITYRVVTEAPES
jgi:SpoVK/Ycf46/Vps4 family AAA+-type ATPase